jgi:hypothetical protein
VTFESFDFNRNNFQMGERNSTAQGSGKVISYSKDRFLLNHHQEKILFLWRLNNGDLKVFKMSRKLMSKIESTEKSQLFLQPFLKFLAFCLDLDHFLARLVAILSVELGS